MRHLEFEKPLKNLVDKIEELKAVSIKNDVDLSEEIEKIEARANKVKKEIYKNLTTDQILQIARHPDRPDSKSLFRLMFDSFIELHGDRCFGDDPSIVTGIGMLKHHRVVIIGHQKGHDTKENIYRNFGMPHPEGYRKALRIMKMAHTFQMPILTFVDTPGAYPGLEAEERGQAEAIAHNLKEMAQFEVPIISTIIGEGGSGGALGIAVANTVLMMEHAIYSVISPEGCSSILFRDASKAGQAAERLKITAPHIVALGVADDIIKEPLGGSHRDWAQASRTMKRRLLKEIEELSKLSPEELVTHRYEKFRKMGQFSEKPPTP